MGKFAMTFGGFHNLIGELIDNEFVPKKYNTLVDYGAKSSKFYSRIKITDSDVVVGYPANGKSRDCIYIDNVGKAFKDDFDKTYEINHKKYSTSAIIKEYFKYIKKELDNHQENDPVESMTLIVPYEYSKILKQELKKILDSINFRVDQIIEEPVASYLGYLKQTNQAIKKTDSFMLIGLEDDNIKVKIFDVEKKDKKLIFKLDGSAFNITFAFYNDLINYFLDKVEDVDVTYEQLDNYDKEKIMEGIDLFFNGFNENPSNSNMFFALSNQGIDFDCDYTSNQLQDIYNEIGLFKKINQTIDDCMNQSGKSRSDIDKIIYTGNISTIFGIQDKINRDFNLNQELMLDIDEITCLGGVSYNNLEYSIEDHLKQIGIGFVKKVGIFRSVTIFKSLMSSYSNIKTQSLKIKIPAGFKGALGIYEGYNGALIDDCALLKKVDLKDYNNGNYKFKLVREAQGGPMLLEIYNKNNELVKQFNIL